MKSYSLRLPLKSLDQPYVYDIYNDELYELDDQSFNFLATIENKSVFSEIEQEFIEYCLEEEIIIDSCNKHTASYKTPQLEVQLGPTLRYLELQITDICNLKCSHCYMGKPNNRFLSLSEITTIFEEFETISGLKIIISGGEPMLHPDFWAINEVINNYGFRSILITNGTLITKGNVSKLNFNEVQLSIDGLEDAHDLLRGKGSFNKVTKAMSLLLAGEIQTSVGSVIHNQIISDLPKMERLFKKENLTNWLLDVPTISGYLSNKSPILIPYEQAGQYLSYGFGAGLYSSATGYACGSHLCTISPDGNICKCGFYADNPIGKIKDGLLKSFLKITKTELNSLDCKSCSQVEQCRGGCRFRAEFLGGANACDAVLCFANHGACNLRGDDED